MQAILASASASLCAFMLLVHFIAVGAPWHAYGNLLGICCGLWLLYRQRCGRAPCREA